MYLYYFERIVRWAAGDNTLRLPYWDYTDPAQVGLPSEFRTTASKLYDSRRDPGMNVDRALWCQRERRRLQNSCPADGQDIRCMVANKRNTFGVVDVLDDNRRN